jgi:hypothetical protein
LPISRERQIIAESRGDEAEAHIADLYGCDRATWYRRNGYPVAVIDQTTQAKFAIGLAYENEGA